MSVDSRSDEGVVRVDRLDGLTLDWRRAQFARLGFDNPDEMALASVDWHEAAALISAGCTPERVARILL